MTDFVRPASLALLPLLAFLSSADAQEKERQGSLLEGLSREIHSAAEMALRGWVTVELVPSHTAERSWIDAGVLLDGDRRLIATRWQRGLKGGETAYVRFGGEDPRCYRASVVGSLPHLSATILHVDRLEGARALPRVDVVEGSPPLGSLVVSLHGRTPARVALGLGMLSEIVPVEEDAPRRWSFLVPRYGSRTFDVIVDPRGAWLAWLPRANRASSFLDVVVEGGEPEEGDGEKRLRRVQVSGSGGGSVRERIDEEIRLEGTFFPFGAETEATDREGLPVHVLRDEAKELLEARVEAGFSLEGARQPWLGVMVTRHEESEGSRGLVVVDLFEGSPAQRAGLERHDIILEVDGTAVREGIDLVKIIGRRSRADGSLRIKVERRDTTLEVTAQLEQEGGSASGGRASKEVKEERDR